MDSRTYEDVEPYIGEDPLPLFRGDCSVLPINYMHVKKNIIINTMVCTACNSDGFDYIRYA